PGAAGQALTIRAEAHVVEPTRLTLAREDLQPGLCVPDLDRDIRLDARPPGHQPARQTAAVGAEADRVARALDRQQFLTARHIPHPHGAGVGRGQALTVGAEADAGGGAGVGREGERFLASLRIPELDHPVARGAGETPTVGTEAETIELPVPLEREELLAGLG